MSINSLPLLTLSHVDAFNASKKFYHFNHSHYLKSVRILELALQQYNTIIEQNELIEITIREIERSQQLSVLLNNIVLQRKIQSYRRNQATLLCGLKDLLKIIGQQVSALRPIVKKRSNCHELDKLLQILTEKYFDAKTDLVVAQLAQMEMCDKQLALLDQTQFITFHNYIEQNANSKLLDRYHQLSWHQAACSDEKLVNIKTKNKSFYILSSLKTLFQKSITGISVLFFNNKDKENLMQQQLYRIARLKSAQQHLEKLLATITKNSLLRDSIVGHPCEIAIRGLEITIRHHYCLIKQERATGIRRYFSRTKNIALNNEMFFLKNQYYLLQEKRLNLIENAFEMVDELYQLEDLNLPPQAKLQEIETLLIQCEQNIAMLPLENEIGRRTVKRLESIKKKFRTKCDIAKHFIKKMMDSARYFRQNQEFSETGICYLACDEQSINSIFSTLKAYVTAEQQTALETLQSLLLVKNKDNLHLLRKKLLPLFKGFQHPHESLETFLQKVVQQYVLPSLHDPRDSTYKLLEEYDKPLIMNWLTKKIVSLENALLILKYVFLENTPLSNQVILVGNKSVRLDHKVFFAQIHLLKSFSDQVTCKGFLVELYQIVQQSIIKNVDSLCYRGEWLDGIVLLDCDSIKIAYLKSLLSSCITQHSFDILNNTSLIKYLNENKDALKTMKLQISCYFKQNLFYPTLQTFLNQLEDKTLAQHYNYMHIKKILNDDRLDEQASYYINCMSESLVEAIGEENIAGLYRFISETLTSDKTLSVETLSHIYTLLNAKWSQDVKPLKTLLDKRRTLLLEQNEIDFEVKEIIIFIKKAEWSKAVIKLKEHILLCHTDLSRAQIHHDVVLSVLNQLQVIHQTYDREYESRFVKETFDTREQRWHFYQTIRKDLNKIRTSSFACALAAIEKDYLSDIHPIAYFIEQICILQKNNISDSKQALNILSQSFLEIKPCISLKEAEAAEHLISLISGKWTPLNKAELTDTITLLVAGLENQTTYQGIEKYLLTTFVLPNITSINSQEFELLYSINPQFVTHIVAQEKEKIEDNLCLLEEVFTQDVNVSKAKPIYISGRQCELSHAKCVSAISEIIYFSRWQEEHKVEGNNDTKYSFLQILNGIINNYLQRFKKNPHKTLDYLPLLEALLNDTLLDEYLTDWVQYLFNQELDAARIKSDKVISYYRNKSAIQNQVKELIVAKMHALEKSTRRISIKSSRDSGYTLHSFNPNLYSIANQQLILIMDLLNLEQKQEALHIIATKLFWWHPEWQSYIEDHAGALTKQAYRYLFLNNLFSSTDFLQHYNNFFPVVLLDSFNEVYGRENIPIILNLMEDYVEGTVDPKKEAGYRFILASLQSETCTGVWRDLKNNANQHLSCIQEKTRQEAAITELVTKIKSKEFLEGRSKLKQWVLNTHIYSETSLDYRRNCKLLVRFCEVIKDHITDLIKRRLSCEIAIIREYLLEILPNSDEKKHLISLCNQNTSYSFDKSNDEIAELYRRVSQFEQYAWQIFTQHLPNLDETELATFKRLVTRAKQGHQETMHPYRYHLEQNNERYGFSKALAKLYLQNADTIERLLNPVLCGHYYFEKISNTNILNKKTCVHRLSTKENQEKNISCLREHIMKTTLAWKDERNSFWFYLFRNKTSTLTPEECEQHLVRGCKNFCVTEDSQYKLTETRSTDYVKKCRFIRSPSY